jgi:NADP-dependent 3-hydroxy acid dehydrogenase YdfG
MTPLKDQVAVITGASSGIGAAAARELAAAGMKLVLTARRADRLDAMAGELGNAIAFPGDMLDPKLPQALVDLAVERYARCDVVLNNAGFMLTGKIETIDIDEVCRMARVNVEAAYRVAYTALRHFKKAGSGHLVNTSSVLGSKIRTGAGAYAGTKHAIEALSEDLRMEVAGSGVKVSCIEPGIVLTELHDKFEVHPRVSMGIQRPLEPEDIARCIRFVLEQPAHVCIPRLMVLPAEQAI